MLISILDTLSQSRHINEYLKRLVKQVKKYSGCRCVGIRLLDEDGNIPYIAYTGFSREFYEIESPLCVGSDECMCANVIMGNTRLGLPSYTKGGSFLSNGTTKLLASVSEEVKSQTRNVCNRYGYESVALVPMKHGDRILGLIHLADESENKIPPETVRFLERVGVYIGEALHTFMAEEALQESEKQYRDLYEEAPDAYLSCGVDGIIKRANLRAAELLGYSREGLVGRPVSDLYADTPDGKAAAEGVFRRYLAGEEVRNQKLEVKRADGSSVWVSLSVRPMRDKEGRVVASRSIMVDITEHRKLDQLKDDFIGLVSHELRSPMTVITGAINTALTEAERLSPEETRQLLKDAAAESESLSNLLANLLELSRVQAQRLVLYSEAIDVKRVIQDAVDKIKHQYSTHTFVINLPRRLPPLQADPLRLERILYNLLENAVKYSPTGGEVRVSAKPQGEHLVIGVSDQGIGISPADQEKLFAPFQRLEKRPSGVRGVGLGLMVCRRLVEAHGGHIWVESEPSHGSTFFFAMPLSQGSPR
ncbi:Adaptive-response sensory-kinase SasA [subsurface metagenome]